MKKMTSKLSVGLVCVIFGFLITYQLKAVYSNTNQEEIQKQSAEILMENEALRKQKEDLSSKIDELQTKISQYEQQAAGRDEISKTILNELEEMRILNGMLKVNGPGVIVYIMPKSNIFVSGYEGQPILDFDLLTIANELFSAGAEAISINNIRITSTSGIRTAGNSIIISGERISYNKPVEIRAIGNTEILEGALKFPGNIPNRLYQYCDVEINIADEVIIEKSNENFEFEYAVPVEK